MVSRAVSWTSSNHSRTRRYRRHDTSSPSCAQFMPYRSRAIPQASRGYSQLFPIISNDSQLFLLIPDRSHLLALIPWYHGVLCSSQSCFDDLTYSLLFPLVPACSRLFPLVPACSRLFPLVPACSRLFPLVPACSRLFPLIPFYSRLFPLGPAWSCLVLLDPA
jgi:hypothetical protein